MHLLHVGLRHLRADLAETDAVVLQAEDGVRAAWNLPASTCWIVEYTDVSTRFIALVST